MPWKSQGHQITVSVFQDFLVSKKTWWWGQAGSSLLSFHGTCFKSAPGSVLGNWNDPTARWSQPQEEPQPHILVSLEPRAQLSLSLNTCRFTALDLSLPCCFLAELGEPRTHLLSTRTRFFKLLFTSLWGKAAATHLAHPPLDIQYMQAQLWVFKAQKCPGCKSAQERCGDGTQTGQ